MSLLLAAWMGSIATIILALGAIVTSWYAIQAFRKQAEEVADQAKLLGVQSAQLSVLRDQLTDQRKLNKEQITVLTLQARDLEASLSQRQHEAEYQRRSQAAGVVAWFGQSSDGTWGAWIRNASELPILDVRVVFHYIFSERPGMGSWWEDSSAVLSGGDWSPVPRGHIPTIPIIRPQSDLFTGLPNEISRKLPGRIDDTIYAVSVEFTDAAESRWERDARGALASR